MTSGRRADVLSDVLAAIRLSGAVYFDFDLSVPWVAEAPQASEIASVVMPGAQRVIEYHLIASGSAWGGIVGQSPVRLQSGDLLLFPQGHAHVLSSAPGMRTAPRLESYERPTGPLPIVHELGGGGAERARVICCFLGCDDHPFNPLLAALPSIIHLAAERTGSSDWLDTLLHIAVGESGRASPGSENVLARLAELVFVEAVRRHIATLPASHRGWLSGLRDEVVGRALAALHGAPEAAWSVERLARDVGVSRSVLAERFSQFVGQPPMHYLAHWRMQIAARLLHDGLQVGEVGRRVGYESEAAFSRAFRRNAGVPPIQWRRGQTHPPP